MDAKASAEEKFLKAARMGNVALVQKFLSSAPEINVNCIGRNKWNRGWSPVHLSSLDTPMSSKYFSRMELILT
eukprot:m.235194 g.235194  ORF g.235194 m.235194 type:complete len:73 (+) comp40123_c0_seq45:99-317(+)